MGFYTALPGLAPMMDTFRELRHPPLQSQVLPLRSRHTGILTVSESSGDSLSPLITSLADKTSVLPPPLSLQCEPEARSAAPVCGSDLARTQASRVSWGPPVPHPHSASWLGSF